MKYSQLDQRNAVSTYFQLGSFRQAAEHLNIPKSTISKWVSRIGQKTIDKRKGSRHPTRKSVICEKIHTIVKEMLTENQYITICEVHVRLKFDHHIDCSLSSVYRAKDAIGMSRKRSSKVWAPSTDNITWKQRLNEFVETIQEVPIQKVLSVDESSFDSRMVPYYGYSYKGTELKPSRFVSKSLTRDRLSLICGVSCNGGQLRWPWLVASPPWQRSCRPRSGQV